MNEITDRSIMSALGRQMTIAVAKQSVSAGNLANLDTPGYKTKEATFDDLLTQEVQSSGQAAATARGHITGAGVAAPTHGVKETDGLQVRRDGNNVELDRELLKMNQAAGDFSAAQTALTAKFRLVRYALAESR